MIYIIEGPDGSGKTTLASKIMQAYNRFGIARYLHFCPPKNKQEMDNMFDMYKNVIQSENDFDLLVLDRSWISEMVYGPICRGQSCLSKEQFDILNLLAYKHQAIIIHCTGSTGALHYRSATRGEDFITDRKMLEEIRIGFEVVLSTVNEIPIVRHVLPGIEESCLYD